MKSLTEKYYRYEAVFQLCEKKFPELNGATIVITDTGGNVLIGVKALYRKTERATDSIFCSMEMVGDYFEVGKTCTVGEFFGSLEELLKRVADMKKRAEKGDLCPGENKCDQA